jgi:FkbM family methyltransferase
MFDSYRRFNALNKAMGWRDALRIVLSGFGTPEKQDQIHLRADSRPLHFRIGTSDFACFEQIFLDQQYHSPLKIEPLTIVDGGANIGISVRYFANLYPEAEIWAIEPDPSNIEILQQNCGDMPKTHIIPSALWPKKEPVFFTNLDASKWEFEVSNSQPTGLQQALSSITIPELLTQIPSGRINLLKLDIEGAERELFGEGADEWLPKVDAIVIELHDRIKKGCSNAFYKAICKREFHQELVGENVFIYFSSAKVDQA